MKSGNDDFSLMDVGRQTDNFTGLLSRQGIAAGKDSERAKRLQSSRQLFESMIPFHERALDRVVESGREMIEGHPSRPEDPIRRVFP